MGRNCVSLTPHKWAAVALAVCALTGCKGSPAADEDPLGSQPISSTSQAASASGESTLASAGETESTSSTITAGTGTPKKRAPAGSAAAGLAKKSEKLEIVTRPPTSTVSRIDSTKAQAGSKYSIVFSPFGTGPGSAGPGTGLVIRISESRPAADVEQPFDFTGRNVLVDTSRLPSGQTIDEGGTYDGTLELIESGGLLAPYLVNVESGSRTQ